jgi:hypothetical protein
MHWIDNVKNTDKASIIFRIYKQMNINNITFDPCNSLEIVVEFSLYELLFFVMADVMLLE